MIQEKWEKRSTVRSRPRIMFNPEEKGYFFPVSHQPLAVHPKILEKGEDALSYLLIQSFYKYANDIATIETRVVNNAILSVVTDALPLTFNTEQKIDLYTIMVDEAYHAYVAYDVMTQIEKHTNISPLPLPKKIEIEKAITNIMEKLPSKYHGIFCLICVCIAENTLTKEIVMMTDQDETHPFFQKVLKDHLSDEGRHSGFFCKLLAHIWASLDLEYKQAIAKVLPKFLEQYLGVEVQIQFDYQVLTSIGFSNESANEILNDTYAGFKLTKQHPMLNNVLTQLTRSGVIDALTTPYFEEKNWL